MESETASAFSLSSLCSELTAIVNGRKRSLYLPGSHSAASSLRCCLDWFWGSQGGKTGTFPVEASICVDMAEWSALEFSCSWTRQLQDTSPELDQGSWKNGGRDGHDLIIC